MRTDAKSETSLDKIRGDSGRLKSTEITAGGTAQDMRGASQAPPQSVVQQRRECIHRYRTGLPRNPVVPVLAQDGEPLMPSCAEVGRANKSHSFLAQRGLVHPVKVRAERKEKARSRCWN